MARRKQVTFMDFGQGDLNPLWGAAASGLFGTGTAAAVRAFSSMDRHAELIGLGVGVATGAALLISPRSRAAGFTGIATALVTSGLRYVEALASCKQQVKDLTGAILTKTESDCKAQLDSLKVAGTAAGVLKGGFGMVTASPRTALQGFGAMTSEPRTALQGFGAMTSEPRTALQGLGIVTADPRTALQGGIGAARNAGVTIEGGGLASAYGATIFGG
jgi:hypothetical protein